MSMGAESWDPGTLGTLKKFLREIKFGKFVSKKNRFTKFVTQIKLEVKYEILSNLFFISLHINSTIFQEYITFY